MLFLLSGCAQQGVTSSTPSEVQTKATESIQKTTALPTATEVNEVNEATDPSTLNIDNDGGNFSQDDLIYFVVTDRFKRSEENEVLGDVNPDDPYAYHGGNLRGVTESLDYIKSLGTTAIWLTPVQKNGPKGYHGYWIYDFWSVDPHLGTLDDLKNLVREAHKRDIKVLMDYVVNHTGYDTPWFNDPQKKQWFNPKRTITNWNDEKQLERGWLFGLPDLNLDKPEVTQFFIDNALWWIRETGIDGMRLDTVKHVPRSFWTTWNHAIKTEFPDFYLLGEVWSEHVSILERYRDVGIDGVTNYPLYEGLTSALSKTGRVTDLANAIARDQSFSGSKISGIFVDNHDNSRLISKDPIHGKAYLKLGLVWAYTYPAIPILYYGTEVGLEGGKDPDNRRDMPWSNVPHPDLLALTKSLANWRASANNSYAWLYHDDQMAIYLRSDALVVLNFSDQPVSFSIPLSDVALTDLATQKINAYSLDSEQAPILNWAREQQTLSGTFKPFEYGIYPLVP